MFDVENLVADPGKERLFFLPLVAAALGGRHAFEAEPLEIDSLLETLQGIAEIMTDHSGGLPDAGEALDVPELRSAFLYKLLKMCGILREFLGVVVSGCLCLKLRQRRAEFGSDREKEISLLWRKRVGAASRIS